MSCTPFFSYSHVQYPESKQIVSKWFEFLKFFCLLAAVNEEVAGQKRKVGSKERKLIKYRERQQGMKDNHERSR